MKKILNFHSDPGHGWLEVPLSELVKYDLLSKISTCSYVNGVTVYLEEDVDAGVYLDALKAAGVEVKFNEIFVENTPIRNYPRYVG